MPRRFPADWYPRRGEVYLVELPGGKARPAVILSADALNKHALDICLVPLTTVHHREFSLRVPVAAGEGGLERDSWAKCDQVHTLEKMALCYPRLGRLAAGTMARIEEALRVTLQL